jgi:nucleotide-binding universal stress UspA family protein
MLNIRRILVPVDFSDFSVRALAHAGGLAETHDAALTLLHVIEEPTFPAFYEAASAVYGPPPDLTDEARAALHRLVDEADLADGLEVTCVVQVGRAAPAIIDWAEAHETDVVVLASHGLTGLKHLLLGSVAEKVVQRAPCPVFIVKAFGRSLVEERG